ncbi:response regulator [Oxalobacteraceae bacterium A2-2]
MAELKDMSVLIVDPSQGMRGNLQTTLGQAGITRIDHAVSAGTAVRQLSRKAYDIVLCEYDLGSGSGDSGQDGQQLLEDLRHNKLIDPSTIFIMLTAEGVYSKVIGAAELAPTDYVLKPFTAETLLQRITRAAGKRAALLPVHELAALGSLRKAIRTCQDAEQRKDRYAADFARLRAELLAGHGELAEAELAYQAILMSKPVGWAYLGLARCQFGQEKYPEAQQTLEGLILQYPRLMAAYDLLAQTLLAMGQNAAAKKVLEDAVEISPHLVRRLRHLGEVAFESGDVGVAERAFRQVVARARYSEFRNPEDHVNLVRALVKRGDVQQAGGVIRDLERSMRGNANADACRAIAVALLQELAGDQAAAAAGLATAVAAVGNSSGLSAGLRIGLVHSCLKNKLDMQASELMIDLMNDAGSGVSMDEAVAVFEQAGRHDLARGVGQQIERQLDEVLSESRQQRASGDLRAAVDTLSGALRKAPRNVTLLAAATSAMLKQLDDLGWEAPLAQQTGMLIGRIQRLDPAHPQLVALLAQYASTQRKYGISTTA